jgi:hypothetical protein
MTIEPCKVCGAPGKTTFFIGNEKQHYCAEHYAVAADKADKEHKAALAKWHQANIDRGVAYWAARGIEVGDEMYAIVGDMLTGGMLGSEEYRGYARVSKIAGPYVYCPTYKGRLAANFFKPVKDRQSVTPVTPASDEFELMLSNREF